MLTDGKERRFYTTFSMCSELNYALLNCIGGSSISNLLAVLRKSASLSNSNCR